MKNWMFLIWLILTLNFKAQISCNQSSLVPTHIFNPNSTTTFSSNAIETLYLCGPNTVVYDTAVYLDCRHVMVNAGCNYIFNIPNGCSFTSEIYAKNSSTITVNGGIAVAITIAKEPFATIICPTSISVPTITCASLTFPTVNCFSGINEFEIKSSQFFISPNPTNTILNIEILNEYFEVNNSELRIVNILGQEIKNIKLQSKKQQINIEEIESGIYYLQLIHDKNILSVRKIIKQ